MDGNSKFQEMNILVKGIYKYMKKYSVVCESSRVFNIIYDGFSRDNAEEIYNQIKETNIEFLWNVCRYSERNIDEELTQFLFIGKTIKWKKT